ncbi:uncharacterized protein BDR25DRAFT_352223 [Lindgomyces ingoldianus]|uniref:Uncharacterized protein n=1 Tax=Lindgomyces ingoldianus TaxID=673940 RepID=A0ACB6R5J2_9PLEO|nr:uncharacterized protein BDR25DRAFT_352223 [Lindgomyces ingoldianus]KAF2473721.1 hypothetical protein BDR25DRAFT_352223 [Lindgomyces ingoldianus]
MANFVPSTPPTEKSLFKQTAYGMSSYAVETEIKKLGSSPRTPRFLLDWFGASCWYGENDESREVESSELERKAHTSQNSKPKRDPARKNMKDERLRSGLDSKMIQAAQRAYWRGSNFWKEFRFTAGHHFPEILYLIMIVKDFIRVRAGETSLGLQVEGPPDPAGGRTFQRLTRFKIRADLTRVAKFKIVDAIAQKPPRCMVQHPQHHSHALVGTPNHLQAIRAQWQELHPHITLPQPPRPPTPTQPKQNLPNCPNTEIGNTIFSRSLTAQGEFQSPRTVIEIICDGKTRHASTGLYAVACLVNRAKIRSLEIPFAQWTNRTFGTDRACVRYKYLTARWSFNSLPTSNCAVLHTFCHFVTTLPSQVTAFPIRLPQT